MTSQNQQSKKRRREFLLSFFDKANEFQVREVNGFVLTKNILPTGKAYVAIFTEASFKKQLNYLTSGHTEERKQGSVDDQPITSNGGVDS